MALGWVAFSSCCRPFSRRFPSAASIYDFLHSKALADFKAKIAHWLGQDDVTTLEIEALPDNPYAPLKQIALTIMSELRLTGVSPRDAENVAGHVLLSLLNDPDGAERFVQALAQGAA